MVLSIASHLFCLFSDAADEVLPSCTEMPPSDGSFAIVDHPWFLLRKAVKETLPKPPTNNFTILGAFKLLRTRPPVLGRPHWIPDFEDVQNALIYGNFMVFHKLSGFRTNSPSVRLQVCIALALGRWRDLSSPSFSGFFLSAGTLPTR